MEKQRYLEKKDFVPQNIYCKRKTIQDVYFQFLNTPLEEGMKEIGRRLILMFLSTEIFSKRRKIYTWYEEKPELRW